MKNTKNEMGNRLHAIHIRLEEAEERITDIVHKIMGNNEAKQERKRITEKKNRLKELSYLNIVTFI